MCHFPRNLWVISGFHKRFCTLMYDISGFRINKTISFVKRKNAYRCSAFFVWLLHRSSKSKLPNNIFNESVKGIWIHSSIIWLLAFVHALLVSFYKLEQYFSWYYTFLWGFSCSVIQVTLRIDKSRGTISKTDGVSASLSEQKCHSMGNAVDRPTNTFKLALQ